MEPVPGTAAPRAVGTGAAGTAIECRVRPPAPLNEVARLVEELRVHPVLAATIWARGLRERVGEQLAADLTLASIPALVPAAERLARALQDRERIVLHGDYDADGVSATALLTLGLRQLGARVSPYVPDRLRDGYGVDPARVAEHAAAADLFVTLDCGINDLAAIGGLRAAGVDVIVTDHHVPGEDRPAALVVHPVDGEGTADLTGAGVAFHLLWALHSHLGLEPPLDLVDLAALGTIADVAPLLGPNRGLVRRGLERMGDSRRPGLRALVALSKLRAPLTARHVAYVLGPRINAAGRLGRAEVALELLLTADERRGRVLATLLGEMNEQRRGLQERMLSEALAMADDAPAVVVRHDAWHPGLLGVVANQLLERLHRPVFVVAQGKGSVRSIAGVSAMAALRTARQHLTRWGGHDLAAGFTLEESAFDVFREAICSFVAANGVPPRSLVADAVLHPSQVDQDFHRAIQALEPYGEGHREPLFALAARLDELRPLGKDGAHVQTRLQGLRAVGWGMGPLAATWPSGEEGVSLATVATSTWQERTTIELRLQAVAAAGSLRLAADACAPADRQGTNGDATTLRIGPPQPTDGGAVVVRALTPTDTDPLAPLGAALRAGGPVYLDLGPAGPTALRHQARSYPSISDARHAFVLVKRGRPWPWHGPQAERLARVLEELGLVDEQGRARAGRRVDPFEAPTLRASAVIRYALESLAALLEALPPAEAAAAVHGLVATGDAGPMHR
jgi:single-stranded-DNA-specific exonuclease